MFIKFSKFFPRFTVDFANSEMDIHTKWKWWTTTTNFKFATFVEQIELDNEEIYFSYCSLRFDYKLWPFYLYFWRLFRVYVLYFQFYKYYVVILLILCQWEPQWLMFSWLKNEWFHEKSHLQSVTCNIDIYARGTQM